LLVLHHLDPAFRQFVQWERELELGRGGHVGVGLGLDEGGLGQDPADQRVHQPGLTAAERGAIRSWREQRRYDHPSLGAFVPDVEVGVGRQARLEEPFRHQVGIEYPLQSGQPDPVLFQALDLGRHVQRGCGRPSGGSVVRDRCAEAAGRRWLGDGADFGDPKSRSDGLFGEWVCLGAVEQFGAVEQLGQRLAGLGTGPRVQAGAFGEIGRLGGPPRRAGRNRAGHPGRVKAGQARQRCG
jgi:hypothetical protein